MTYIRKQPGGAVGRVLVLDSAQPMDRWDACLPWVRDMHHVEVRWCSIGCEDVCVTPSERLPVSPYVLPLEDESMVNGLIANDCRGQRLEKDKALLFLSLQGTVVGNLGGGLASPGSRCFLPRICNTASISTQALMKEKWETPSGIVLSTAAFW